MAGPGRVHKERACRWRPASPRSCGPRGCLWPMPITATRPLAGQDARHGPAQRRRRGGAPARCSKRALPRPGFGGPWRWRGRGSKGVAGDCSRASSQCRQCPSMSASLPVSPPTRRAPHRAGHFRAAACGGPGHGCRMLAVAAPVALRCARGASWKAARVPTPPCCSSSRPNSRPACCPAPRARQPFVVVDRDPGPASPASPCSSAPSLSSCPWDLQTFGGMAGTCLPGASACAMAEPGHCFPSATPAPPSPLAGGWALARYPRAARAWLVAVVLLSAQLYGVGQLLRGAHYPATPAGKDLLGRDGGGAGQPASSVWRVKTPFSGAQHFSSGDSASNLGSLRPPHVAENERRSAPDGALDVGAGGLRALVLWTVVGATWFLRTYLGQITRGPGALHLQHGGLDYADPSACCGVASAACWPCCC